MVSFGFLSAILILAGCSKNPAPPPPLAVERIPMELDQAFKAAQPEIKELVGKLNSSLQKKEYTEAYDAVQALGNVPGTTMAQRSLVSRAMLTIYGLLQTAQEQGNEKAAAALQYYRMTK